MPKNMFQWRIFRGTLALCIKMRTTQYLYATHCYHNNNNQIVCNNNNNGKAVFIMIMWQMSERSGNKSRKKITTNEYAQCSCHITNNNKEQQHKCKSLKRPQLQLQLQYVRRIATVNPIKQPAAASAGASAVEDKVFNCNWCDKCEDWYALKCISTHGIYILMCIDI